jgi:hypothetical protein
LRLLRPRARVCAARSPGGGHGDAAPGDGGFTLKVRTHTHARALLLPSIRLI